MLVDTWELWAPGSRTFKDKPLKSWLVVRCKGEILVENESLKYSEHTLCATLRDALKIAYARPLRLVKVYAATGQMVFCTAAVDAGTGRMLVSMEKELEKQ